MDLLIWRHPLPLGARGRCIGRTDLPGGSHAMLIKSITDKLLPLGDDVAFICGHGPGSTVGHERASNPFLTGNV